MVSTEKDKERNPFVKGSVYRIRSLGSREEPVLTTGEFLGFTHIGMSSEALKIELGADHGEDAGRVRVVPVHMLLHIDVLQQKESEEPEKDDSHPVSYS